MSVDGAPDTTVPEGLVDVHTHAVAADLRAPEGGGSYLWPRLEAAERASAGGPAEADILVGQRCYRRIDERSWSASARLADMDAEGVAVQVLSPIPVTLCHDAPPEPAAAYARAQNTAAAALVAEAPGRFRALGAVPLQDTARAVAELRYAVEELGFLGVEIGTRVGDLELSDPSLEPFFDAADALGALVLVHPVDGTLDPRLGAAGLAFGIGMPGETAVAAAGLLTAGTLVGRPGIRVCLAHGGGALPGVLGRVARGQELAAGGPVRAEASAVARAGALWCDSLTYDAASLRLALDRFGPEHVLLGTDYPFAARESPPGAVLAELTDPGLSERIGSANARALLARGVTPARH